MALIGHKAYLDLLLNILFFGGALMNFLPLFLGYSLKRESLDGEFPDYLHRLQEFPFKSSLVASIASFAPILIDLILNTFSRTKSQQNYVPRKAIISALIIPDLLLLLYILPCKKYDLVPGLGGMRDTVFHFVILSHLHMLRPDIFLQWQTMLIATLVMFVCIILSFLPILTDTSHQNILLMVVECLIMMASATVLYLCYKWFLNLYQQRHRQCSIKDQTSTVYIISYTVFFFMDSFLGFYPDLGKNPMWGAAGANFLTLYNYTMAASLTVISVMAIRFTRIESEQNKSKIRQMFVSYFCHEMNTPLNAAVMGVQVLKHDFPVVNEFSTAAAAAYIDVVADIEHSCNTLMGILNDLVIYEKVESHCSASMKIPGILAHPIILERLRHYQEFAANQSVELVVHDCAAENRSSCIVFADKNFLHQIIRTVLSNSIESAGAGGKVDVTLHLRPKPLERDLVFFGKNAAVSDGYELCVEVRDDGPVLSDVARGNLFQGVDIDFTAGVIEMGRLSGFGILVTRKLLHLLGGSLDYHPLEAQKSRSSARGGQPVRPDTDLLEDIVYETPKRPFGNLITVRIPAAVTGFGELASDHSIFNDQTSIASVSNVKMHNFGNRNLSDSNLSGRFAIQGRTQVLPSTNNDDKMQRLSTSNLSLSEFGGIRVQPHSHKYTIPHVSSNMTGKASGKDSKEDDLADEDDDGEGVGRHTLGATEPPESVLTNRAFKALVVDDSAINRKMLVRLIQSVCGTIECAEDGQEAIEVFQRAFEEGNPFDMVLMDYQMPRMDGPSAAKLMREMGYKGPIVGVTGNVLPAHTQTFIGHGANAVLLKPVKSEDLLRTILTRNCS